MGTIQLAEISVNDWPEDGSAVYPDQLPDLPGQAYARPSKNDWRKSHPTNTLPWHLTSGR